MLTTLIISICTIILLIIAIIVKPNIKIGKFEIQTFWIVPLIGVLFLFLFKCITFTKAKEVLFANTAINPIKILVLFLCVSFLSIVLDEAGFFKLCAQIATKVTNGSQKRLFLALAIIVSVLTVFTSNDIVILTFTLFICYFAKHAKINPMPYLIGEFVFANTWSMMLIIGNPTNIYLAESYNIDFIKYFFIMAFPSILSGVVSYFVLTLIFNKKLSMPMDNSEEEEKVEINKELMIVGLIHLVICTLFLAISSYVGLSMWLISLICAGSLAMYLIIYYIIRKDNVLLKALKRLSWNLIPFILSMFIIVSSLVDKGVILDISESLERFCTSANSTIITYGVTSFLSCNILNNIPMSVMFEKIISSSGTSFIKEKIFSTVASSNLGAYLTPIGALAGIMWMSILNKAGLKFKFIDFIKYGVIIAPIVLIVALGTLIIEL